MAKKTETNPAPWEQENTHDSLLKLAEFFRTNRYGILLGKVLMLLLVIVIDLLISGDNLKTFYLLFGIEVLLLGAYCWAVYIYRHIKRQ